jgi:hypothetical protein
MGRCFTLAVRVSQHDSSGTRYRLWRAGRNCLSLCPVGATAIKNKPANRVPSDQYREYSTNVQNRQESRLRALSFPRGTGVRRVRTRGGHPRKVLVILAGFPATTFRRCEPPSYEMWKRGQTLPGLSPMELSSSSLPGPGTLSGRQVKFLPGFSPPGCVIASRQLRRSCSGLLRPATRQVRRRDAQVLP